MSHLLLTISMLTAAYSLAIVLIEARAKALGSPLTLTAGLTFLHFVIPATLLGLGSGYAFVNKENEKYAVDAIVFIFLVLATLHAGMWFSANWRTHPSSRLRGIKIEMEWNSSAVATVTSMLLVIGWLTRLYVIENNGYFQISRSTQGDLEGPFYAGIRLAELFPLHALCILVIHTCSLPLSTMTRWWRYSIRAVMLVEFLYWLPSGRKEETILVLILPIILRYVLSRKAPSLKAIVSLSLFLVALFPIAHVYRLAMETTVGQGNDAWEIARDAASVLIGVGFAPTGVSFLDVIIQRIDLLESVSGCMRLVDIGEWTLFLGKSYAMALLAIVPRLAWSEKPDLHYGTEFGHAAGYLDSDDWATSISVTFPGEAYLNFAWLGFLPFLPIGVVYGMIFERIRFAKFQETAALLYAVTLPTILYVGGTFASYFGGLIKMLPFYMVIGWIMRRHAFRLSIEDSSLKGQPIGT